MLHSELLANLKHPKPKKDMYGKLVESRRTPVYVVTTSNASAISIELAARRPTKSTDCHDGSQRRKRQRTSSEPRSTNEEDFKNLHDSTPGATVPTSTTSSPDFDQELLDVQKYKEDQLNRTLPGGDLAIPHVLISLALEGEQLLDLGAWNQWLKTCPLFAKYARVEGLYKSHSTLVILSVPVFIWNLLPERSSVFFHCVCPFY
jgi:hypothetical protein